MRSVARCAPRAGFRCDRHGVPRLPARRSGPAGGPAPARPSLGHGGPSLRPRSRCARSKRSLRVAFRPCSAHAAGGPRAAAFDRLLMAAIISPPSLRPRSRCARSKRSLRVAFRPCSAHAAGGPRAAAFDRLLMAAIISPRRAPPALAEGFQTLPRGRLRKPSAHHPDGLARYALRRTNRRSSGLPAAMILPCARAQGRANRSLRLAPGSLPPGDGPLATARSHQSVSKAGRLVCMQCCGFHSHC